MDFFVAEVLKSAFTIDLRKTLIFTSAVILKFHEFYRSAIEYVLTKAFKMSQTCNSCKL